MRIASLTALAASIFSLAAMAGTAQETSAELRDRDREDRPVPVELYFPADARTCTPAKPCPVALLSPGYGLRHTDYAFLSQALAKEGYLVAAIQHDLPTDPPLARSGDLVALRTPAWKRGAQNLRFVRDALSQQYREYDWSHPVLIGHSNGGDLSALALRETPAFATTLITLDNRRFPLPRDPSTRTMSIRGSDFEADPGVLPTGDAKDSRLCITEIAGARHDDMNDFGPATLKADIVARVTQFLQDERCGS